MEARVSRVFKIEPQEKLMLALEIAGHFAEVGFVQDTLDTLAEARTLDDKTHEPEIQRIERKAYENGIENVLGWPSKFAKSRANNNRLFAIGMLYVAQDYAGFLGASPGNVKWPSIVRAKVDKDFVLIDESEAAKILEEEHPRAQEYFYEAKRNYVEIGWITATQGAVKVLEEMGVPKTELIHWPHNAKVRNYMDKIVTAMSEARRYLKQKQIEEAKKHFVRAQILTDAIDKENPA